MDQYPSTDSRKQLLSRIPAIMLAELLEAGIDLAFLLSATLKVALRGLEAERGLAFDSTGQIATVGFTADDARMLCQDRLSTLLLQSRTRHYARPGFQVLAEGSAPVVGMSGTIRAPRMACVLAVERGKEPFCHAEQGMMTELLRLLSRPFQRAVPLARAPDAQENSIRVEDLPVARLDPFPRITEVERLLIEEAMVRFGSKTAAAAALGMTREGLRKKMIRLGLGPPVKTSRPEVPAEAMALAPDLSFPAAG